MSRRWSLRWRVTAALGAGSLLIVSVLAVTTWNLATSYLLDQREQAAVRQAQLNVRLVDAAIRDRSSGLDELLTGLTTGPDSSILVYRPGRWLSSGRQIPPQTLPGELLDLGRAGEPARQRLLADGIPALAVVLPVVSEGGFYIELFPLVELDRTMRFLSIVLTAATVASGLLGGGLGWWASRRALRPLTTLTDAASRIAAGEHDARLPAQTDPDLAPLAATFNATAEALEHRVQQDARFAGDVSHELRSPLTTMANAAEVLDRRREAIPAPARRALDLLVSEIHRFQRMVVDLLEISRARQESDEQSWELVDLGDVVRRVLEHRNQPDVLKAPEPALVLADRRRLDRVVGNLLDNADRYAGGVLRIAVTSQGGKVRLEVDDQGPGVPEELRSRIFERFTRGQARGRGTDTGSGLGLAIVADHVARHGGTVRVEERPGGGARFVIELPEAE
ncbi:sensor histidine kinase [Amycolatopsis magusensis]|uniref:sensor histidine kinase n=1 Tax=Amycolatopsis magusensis TaxID=882444 RepID=UPI0024A914D8|nr:HAMP domain-containing sensor histidine kinase [Amycolatopsis magusensis]MDI5976758.1 HAMP domain-containing sensor histidine kinase [Amycolatopsis magusensis]